MSFNYAHYSFNPPHPRLSGATTLHRSPAVTFAAFAAIRGAVMIRLPDYFLAAGATLPASTASAAAVRERPRVTAISGVLLTVQRRGSHSDCRSSFRVRHPRNGCCRKVRPAHPRRRAWKACTATYPPSRCAIDQTRTTAVSRSTNDTQGDIALRFADIPVLYDN